MISRPLAAASMLAAAILVTAPAHASAALTHATVHLLAGPATTFGPIADVPGNSQVGVLWCGPANFDWCLIQFHKKQGWVHSSDLGALTAGGSSLADANKSGGGLAAAGGSSSGGGGGASDAPKAAKDAESRQTGGTGPNAGSVGSGGSHAVGAGL